MKVILLTNDSGFRKASVKDLDISNVQGFYQALSTDKNPVDTIDIIPLANPTNGSQVGSLYVALDDLGMVKIDSSEVRENWSGISNGNQPIVGNVIVFSMDQEGNKKDITENDLKQFKQVTNESAFFLLTSAYRGWDVDTSGLRMPKNKGTAR